MRQYLAHMKALILLGPECVSKLCWMVYLDFSVPKSGVAISLKEFHWMFFL